jgi:hypothetical protein
LTDYREKHAIKPLRNRAVSFPRTRDNKVIHVDTGLIDYVKNTDVNDRGTDNERVTERERDLLTPKRKS